MDHSFGVLDNGEIPMDTADHSNGLVVMLATGALIYTGIDTGNVRLRAHSYAEPPQELDEATWEEIVEVSVHAPFGQLQIDSLHTGPVPALPVLSKAGPGWYRLRAHARGRDTAYDAVSEEPVEDYLIQVWPAQPTPTVIIRATDRCGQGLRESAAQTRLLTEAPIAHDVQDQQELLRRNILKSMKEAPRD